MSHTPGRGMPPLPILGHPWPGYGRAMAEPVDNERREHVRVEVDLPVTWRLVHFDSEDEPRPGRALDISEGGLRLELTPGDQLNLGDVVRIDVASGSVTLSRQGLVVSTRAGIHVAFRRADADVAPPVLATLGLS